MSNGDGTQKAMTSSEAPPPLQRAILQDAHGAASYLEQIGDDAISITRAYHAECQRLAKEFRRATEAMLTRLVGEDKSDA